MRFDPEYVRLLHPLDLDPEEVAAEIARLQARVAELEGVLEPFAAQADGRRRRDINGAVCFGQSHLLRARAALKGADQ